MHIMNDFFFFLFLSVLRPARFNFIKIGPLGTLIFPFMIVYSYMYIYR
jgi:hypothetical protein